MYELPLELPNDLKLSILEKLERLENLKSLSFSENKNFVDTSKKPLKNRN